MDNLRNTKRKYIKTILFILIPILIILSGKAYAYNWFDLSHLIAHIGKSCRADGEAPWYTTQEERYVVYPNPVHYQALQNDEVQELTVSSKAVYCCDLYSHVRSGEFTDKVYYLADSSTGYTPSEAKAQAEAEFDTLTGLNYQMNRNAHTEYMYSDSDTFQANNGRRKVTNIGDAYFKQPAVFNENGYGYIFKDYEDYANYVDEMEDRMQELFQQIDAEQKVDYYDNGADVTYPNAPKSKDIMNDVIGPVITIMEKEKLEQHDAANEGYKKTEGGEFSNNAEAYVLTAIGGLYNEGRREYTYLTIQYAWWQLVDTGISGHDEFGTDPHADVEAGDAIKNEALAYEAYKNTYLGSNGKLKSEYFGIDKDNAEAIIDQEEQSYTVGPFTLSYPSSVSVGKKAYSLDKIIYVKGLTLRTHDSINGINNTFYYDELNNDFQILYPTGSSGTIGGSGLTKVYPRSNNKFYVKFYSNGGNGYAACGTPDKVDVSFSLEYLTTTDADYQVLESNANLYCYIGHMDVDTEFTGQALNRGKIGDEYNTKAPIAGLHVNVTYVDAKWVSSGYYQFAEGEDTYDTADEFREAYPDEFDEDDDVSDYWENTSHYEWDEDNPHTKDCFVEKWYFQPYIQMSTYRYDWYVLPQRLMYTDKGHRKYITILSSATVDIKMDLGGKVFEDLRRGKHNVLDGFYAMTTGTSGEAQDYPMQNVIVLLYRHRLGNSLGENEKGEFIAWTKTDENGNYLFQELNEMYKYHVEFIYNGQYYEPTKYTMYESYNKSTNQVRKKLKDDGETNEQVLNANTRKNRWEKSSKALESYDERDKFNEKFAEIGAYPTNIVPDSNSHLQYPTTYREDLEDKKIIDKILTDNNLRKSAGILLDYNIDSNGNIVVTNNSSIYSDYARESLMRAYTYENYDDGAKQLDIFLYPISEVFVDKQSVKTTHTQVVQKPIKALYEVLDDESIDEMHHINLGLVDREEMKLKLEKDVATIYFEVNGKTHMYNYHTRYGFGDTKVGYGLDVRAIDGYARYREDLTREIYREDYEYEADLYRNLRTIDPVTGEKTNMTEQDYLDLIAAKETGELEIYVQYKMAVSLTSSFINARITEIVDYYDKEFTLIGNDANGTSADRVKNNNVVTQEEVNKYAPFYGNLNTTRKIDAFEKQYAELTQNRINISNTSIYKDDKNAKKVSDPEDEFLKDYNRVYFDTSAIYLEPDNANFTVYATYRVNKTEVNGKRKYVILDEAGDMTAENAAYIMASKVNIAEINGYKTYYYDEENAPNHDNYEENYANGEYNEGDVAGIVDRYSTPGNLEYVTKEKVIDVKDDSGTTHKVLAQAEKVAKESDSDMAPLLHIILNRVRTRTILGNVWEDERADDGMVSKGDGVRQDTEAKVNGVIVQLVELDRDNDGKVKEEHVWKQYKTGKTDKNAITSVMNIGVSKDTTQTDEGQYAFIGIPAGDYIVRFIYGADASSAIGTEAVNYETGKVTSDNNPVFKLVNKDGLINLENEILNQAEIYDPTGANGNKNLHSYTGNDYKSTTYRKGIYEKPNHEYTTNGSEGNIDSEPAETGSFEFSFAANENVENVSDAKDIWSRREIVNNYSKDNLTNHRAEVLSSFETIPDGYGSESMNKLLGELYAYTYMVAESGVIDFEIEYDRTQTDNKENGVGTSNRNKSGCYEVTGLDFGLERRPRAQLKTTNQVINVKVTLANGNTLFDARDTATNVQWMKHIAHNDDIDNKYDGTNYSGNKMKIPSVRAAGANGIINLTMDEELMQGARIDITYAITIANIGEVDYKTIGYYYKGNKGGTNDIVTTTPNDVLVYVGYQPNVEGKKNNLLFNQADNPNWEVIPIDTVAKPNSDTLDNRTNEYDKIGFYAFLDTNDKFETALNMNETVVDDNLLRFKLKDEAKNYNTIIHTNADNSIVRPLIPIKADSKATGIDDKFANDPLNIIRFIQDEPVRSVSGEILKLSTVISGDTKGTDMIYNNLVEVVKVSNDVGRRQNYSIVGNQDPTTIPYEIDADISQEVSILPPFGQTQRYYYLGFGVASILIVGTLMVIAFTKKKDDDNGKMEAAGEGKK